MTEIQKGLYEFDPQIYPRRLWVSITNKEYGN